MDNIVGNADKENNETNEHNNTNITHGTEDGDEHDEEEENALDLLFEDLSDLPDLPPPPPAVPRPTYARSTGGGDTKDTYYDKYVHVRTKTEGVQDEHYMSLFHQRCNDPVDGVDPKTIGVLGTTTRARFAGLSVPEPLLLLSSGSKCKGFGMGAARGAALGLTIPLLDPGSIGPSLELGENRLDDAAGCSIVRGGLWGRAETAEEEEEGERGGYLCTAVRGLLSWDSG